MLCNSDSLEIHASGKISAKYYVAFCMLCNTFKVKCPVKDTKVLSCCCTYHGSLERKCSVNGVKGSRGLMVRESDS